MPRSDNAAARGGAGVARAHPPRKTTRKEILMLDSLLAAVGLPMRIEPYIPWLTWLDKHLNLHPMLVSFTTALLTASLFSDYAAKVVGRESLRSTAAWCMLFAGIITPVTGLMGWFFWGPGDDDPKFVGSMTIHMWLGTALVVCYIALALWRWRYFRRNKGPGGAYLAAATVVFAAVLLQAKIAGDVSTGTQCSGRPRPNRASRAWHCRRLCRYHPRPHEPPHRPSS
jgi:uncharacterized membrane protein